MTQFNTPSYTPAAARPTFAPPAAAPPRRYTLDEVRAAIAAIGDREFNAAVNLILAAGDAGVAIVRDQLALDVCLSLAKQQQPPPRRCGCGRCHVRA